MPSASTSGGPLSRDFVGGRRTLRLQVYVSSIRCCLDTLSLLAMLSWSWSRFLLRLVSSSSYAKNGSEEGNGVLTSIKEGMFRKPQFLAPALLSAVKDRSPVWFD